MRLLIEIGVEELPAIPFLKEYKNILPKWQKVLEKYEIKADFSFDFTPRRMVLDSSNFPNKQDDKVVEQIGAPKRIAIKDGIWSKAAVSFAKKCGIDEDKLGFKKIGNDEFLYYEYTQKGKDVKEILSDMINDFLKELYFGKEMRWGNGEFEFIRPIRSLAVCLNNENVEMQIYGVRSKLAFYPHRSFGYDLVEFKSADEYYEKLAKNGIILNSKKREEKILNEFKNLEKINSFEIEKDKDLLNEVIAITEHPTALKGEFDKEFLNVPDEVIITSMKENQRYFPVFNNGKLTNNFVFVSNAVCDDGSLIVSGNERVLKARLSDAMFFWQSDLKNGLNPDSLKNVLYIKELGSIYDKELREIKIALNLAKLYKNELEKEVGKEYEKLLERAIVLSKADLTTLMVDEFGELQGIMGSYYAKAMGENENIVKAIKEQYLPDGEKSELPSSIFSSIVALSFKLDSLMGLFSVGKIPSGTKDPYALRRAANGIIKIVLNKNLNFNLNEILEEIAPNYTKFNLQILQDFIFDRLNTVYDANISIINACLKSGESDIKKLNNSILALDEISKKESFKENFSTFKRLANIIKDEKIKKVDDSLISQNAERELNNSFNSLKLDLKDSKSYLNELFGLKEKIDKFFDEIMINVDDESLKANRIAIIGQIYNSFLKVADIKEISF